MGCMCLREGDGVTSDEQDRIAWNCNASAMLLGLPKNAATVRTHYLRRHPSLVTRHS